MININFLKEQIIASKKNIENLVEETELVQSKSLSLKFKNTILLKYEHKQKTGSFKIRGALNALINLKKTQNMPSVIAFSSGNHGYGLAKASYIKKFKCVICMSSNVPQNKVNLIKAQKAEVRILGNSQDEVELKMLELIKKEKFCFIPPFDHQDIICGQGTIGIEILNCLIDIDKIIIPVSGGGLISGISIVIKQKFPNCKVIGVSMEKGAAMYQSQKNGYPIKVQEKKTIADALCGGIGLNNKYTFELVKKFVDEIVTVSEKEIIEAIKYSFHNEGQIIEGAGAVGIASILSKKVKITGTTLILLSGANIDKNLHKKIIYEY